MFFDSWKSCRFPLRVVGGFETLTAMENVESDPKTDRPKVRVKHRGAVREGASAYGLMWQRSS